MQENEILGIYSRLSKGNCAMISPYALSFGLLLINTELRLLNKQLGS